MVYAPWLMGLLLLALVPAFLGEAHFNAQSYSLRLRRTPERRELDYVRQTGRQRRDREGGEDLRPPRAS
jgi:ATP-binding cassette subfamily B protein